MEILVTYDVSTETKEGRTRLRRVAKACEGHGQRVQKSVFECTLNEGQFEEFKAKLLKEININEDSLRFYRLREARNSYLQSVGKQLQYDMHEPLIL